MFYRNCSRFMVVAMMALLLTIATASVAAAQPSPAASGSRQPAPNPIIDPPPPPPTDTDDDPPPPPPPGQGGGQQTGSGGGQQTGSGGGVPPPPTVNGLIRPVIYPWPPPNAIVLHAATPIQLSAAGTGLRVYFIARDGSSDVGPFFDTFSILAQNHPTDAVTLYSGSNPGTGKPVIIEYLPAENKLRVQHLLRR